MSLTGDATTDELVPVAQRVVGAVRDMDWHQLDECLAEAIETTGGRCDPAVALLVVCAAMVPEDSQPSRLLGWVGSHVEYDRLTRRGVPVDVARQLTEEEAA